MYAPRVTRRLEKLCSCGLVMVAGAALPASAQSLRVDYEAGLSYYHTDNVTLVEENPDSEAVLAPELTINANKQSSTVQLRARGTFQYLDYRSGAYEDEKLGDFAGQLNWYLVPNRLALVFSDYLGRTPIDIVGGLAPGNQQEINVFSAGPTFYMRPSAQTMAQVDLRFADTRASESDDFDGRRNTMAARVTRSYSEHRSVSGNLEVADVDFDSVPGADYRRYDAFAGYVRESSKTSIDAQVGYSRIDRTGADPTGAREDRFSSPLARLRMSWDLTPRSRLDLFARYEIADAARDLVARSENLDVPIIEDLASPNIVVGAELFKQRRIELGYQFTGERLNLYIRPYVERVRYEEPSDAHWDAHGAYVDLSYRLRPRLTGQVWALRERRDLMGLRVDQDTSMRAMLSYDFSRHVSGWIGAQRRQRDSNASGADYRENTVMLGFTYKR